MSRPSRIVSFGRLQRRSRDGRPPLTSGHQDGPGEHQGGDHDEHAGPDAGSEGQEDDDTGLVATHPEKPVLYLDESTMQWRVLEVHVSEVAKCAS